MKVTPTEAAALAGISRTTLYRDMNSGKVSFDRTQHRKSKIDISELERVYGTLKNVQDSNDTQTPVNMFADDTELGRLEVSATIGHLTEKLQTLNLERQREREQLLAQIDHLRGQLDKVGEERRKLTALITDQRSVQTQEFSTHKSEVAALKKQLARLRHDNQYIQDELNKSWFARLLGR